ncbi:hypothetical protein WIS52_28505 [Pseudonocardia nematodicida]|uniref:Uncharacterized protein n=1 Tax=Pseudonocardia nematodicida TaxID=1206997 RepID=A0ABV1KIZ2_9PSEU
MAIQPDSTSSADRAGPSSVPAGGRARWDEVFTESDLGCGILDVRWDLRPRLRRWLSGQNLPSASGRETHRPATDAWALLDGGVIAVSAVTLPGSPPGALPIPGHPVAAGLLPAPSSPLLSPGMRVIGFRTLRLLVSRLGLVPPATALPGEHLDVPGVVEELYDARRNDAEAVEQAELLATCTDRSTLRWVTGALRV